MLTSMTRNEYRTSIMVVQFATNNLMVYVFSKYFMWLFRFSYQIFLFLLLLICLLFLIGIALSEFESEDTLLLESETSQTGTPGPDFWSWTPPPDNDRNGNTSSELQRVGKSQAYPMLSNFVEEKEPPVGFLSIPFQSKLSESVEPLLPPFQSLVGQLEVSESSKETHSLEEDENVGIEFSVLAAEASQALNSVDKETTKGIDPDGSRWWKETGVEQRPDGVICKWTLIRGVSADLSTEWQNKYWEAADEFGYKELGSEKSGRDAYGNVWREYWKESMREVSSNC